MKKPPFTPDSLTLNCYLKVLKDLKLRCEVSPQEQQRDFYSKVYDSVKESMSLTEKVFGTEMPVNNF